MPRARASDEVRKERKWKGAIHAPEHRKTQANGCRTQVAPAKLDVDYINKIYVIAIIERSANIV